MAKWSGLRSRQVLGALALSLAVACGGDSAKGTQDAGAGERVEMTVGKAGGKLQLANGAGVVVPEGALESDVKVAVEEVSDDKLPGAPGGAMVAGPSVAFTPHGQEFKMPVRITVPYDSEKSGKPELHRLDDEKDTSWEEVKGAKFEEGKASFDSMTFSVLRVVLSKADTHSGGGSEDAGAGPVSDMDAGPGAVEEPDYLTVGGMPRNLLTAVITDDGPQALNESPERTHRNYDFVITDGTLELSSKPLDLSWDFLNATEGLQIEVSYPGVAAPLQPGVFTVGETLSANWFVISADSADSQYSSTTGTVTISESGGGYTVEFDLQLINSAAPSTPLTVVGRRHFTRLVYDVDGAAENALVLGAPAFHVDIPANEPPIFRSAWTGSKLWGATDLDGDGLAAQDLLEIDVATGEILQTLTPSKGIWNLNYADGALWDIQSDTVEPPYIMPRFDPANGRPATSWTYGGAYQVYYFWTHDGMKYWGGTNYDCGGNCQAIVTYDAKGQVLQTWDSVPSPDDLIFGGGGLWAALRGGNIYKLDLELNVLASYHIPDYYSRFGEAQFANELPMQLEYINGELWIMDRTNNFYRTGLQ
jgi:hypothetical protein